MKFNLRTALKPRTSRSGNPMEYDKHLLEQMDWLDIIKTNDAFEQWRSKFLERYRGCVGEKGCEDAAKAFERFRGNVNNLVNAVGKLAQPFREGSASHKKIATKSRAAISEVAKNCQIINIELFGLAPLTAAEEDNSGYNKYHISYILILDDFLEYGRLNLCKDLMHELRGIVLDDMADRQVLAAMDEYNRAINRFFSLIQDLGVHRIISKSRELSPVKVPKELLLDIPRGAGHATKIDGSKLTSARSESGNNQSTATSIKSPSGELTPRTVIHDSPKGKKSMKVKKLKAPTTTSEPLLPASESAAPAGNDNKEIRRPVVKKSRESTASLYLEDEQVTAGGKKPLSVRLNLDTDHANGRHGVSVQKLKKGNVVRKDVSSRSLLPVVEANGGSVISNEGTIVSDGEVTGEKGLESKKKKKPISRVRGDVDDNRSVVSISSKQKAKIKAVHAAKGKKSIKPNIKGKKELIRRRAKPTHNSDASLATNPKSTGTISGIAAIQSQDPNSGVLDLERPSSTISSKPRSANVAVLASRAAVIRRISLEEKVSDSTSIDSLLQYSPRTGSSETRSLSQVKTSAQSHALREEPIRSKASEKRTFSKPKSLADRPGKESTKRLAKKWPGSLLDTSSHSNDEQYADNFMFDLPTVNEKDQIVSFESTAGMAQEPGTGCGSSGKPQLSVPQEPGIGNDITRGNRKVGEDDPGEVQETVREEPHSSDGQTSHSTTERGEVRESLTKANDDGSAITLMTTSRFGSETEPCNDTTISAISLRMRTKGPRLWDKDLEEEKAACDAVDDPSKNDDSGQRTTARNPSGVPILEASEESMPSLSRTPSLKKPTSHRSIAPRKKDIPAYSVGHKLDRSTSITRHASVSTKSRTEPEEVKSVQVVSSFPKERAKSRTRADSTDASPEKSGTRSGVSGVFENPPSDKVILSSAEQNSSVNTLRLEAIVSDGEEQHSLFLDLSGHSLLSTSSYVNQSDDKDTLVNVGAEEKEANSSGDYSNALVKKDHGLTMSGDKSNAPFKTKYSLTPSTGNTNALLKKKHSLTPTNGDSSAMKIKKTLKKKGDANVEKSASKGKKRSKPKNSKEGHVMTGWINPFDVGAGEHHFDVTC